MFILRKDIGDDSLKDQDGGWHKYQQYLESVKHRMPKSARDFALAEWHYDFRDHRCPHDGWVEYVDILEDAQGERGEIRNVQINVRLLAAYHDGYIDLTYRNVRSYRISASSSNHGDWLYDEVRISEGGAVVHEVELDNSHFYIECDDIEYEWVDIDV